MSVCFPVREEPILCQSCVFTVGEWSRCSGSWADCYLTDRFSTECENSSWASEQFNIELATYILHTHTHTHTRNTKQPSPWKSSPCRVSGCGKWNYSPSCREESFFLSLLLFIVTPNHNLVSLYPWGNLTWWTFGLACNSMDPVF